MNELDRNGASEEGQNSRENAPRENGMVDHDTNEQGKGEQLPSKPSMEGFNTETHTLQSASPLQEPPAVQTGHQRPVDPKSPSQLLDPNMPGHKDADAQVLAKSRKNTRRSFLVGSAAAAATTGFYAWLNLGKQDETQPFLLRKTFEINAAVSRGVFQEHVLAPTYPVSRSETLRINGIYGLKKDLVPESWRLQLVGMANATQHPRFVKDVTAWQYQYTMNKQDRDEGHDTKVAPKAGADSKMQPGSDTGNKMAPVGKQDNNPDPKDAAGNAPPMPPHAGQGKDGTAGLENSTAAKIGSRLALEKPDNSGNHDGEGQDENHIGRRPRGMEEAGESDSTLSPNTPGLLLTLDDVLKLPRHELVTQFKCIEGWSQIVHWAGVRFADFLEAYPPESIHGREPQYVYMETPDGDYYVGYDLKALRHPQALLVTEMMGAPLTQNHGAPLRLHLPTRYGYKQIKRIALISYTNQKPDDYWTKLGYDWYAGL